MREQCPTAAPALSLVMPHSSQSRRRSSLLSSVSDPHTPPPRDTPLPFLLSPKNNRKSSDSWNSSIYDGADDVEWEWTAEQTRLLSRTLDALPAHKMTPFNGPVPPSSLLDRIAKGVLDAKGPAEWPHSLRQTRAKIIELCRLRATEDTASDTIAEESTDADVLQQTTNRVPKRPLYRQSSMDFMQSAKIDPKENDSIARLSHRLQHTERIIPNPAYPYVRSSPRPRAGTRTLVSTASSSTLNSQSSCSSIGSRIPRLRRSLSSLSNSSESYIQQPATVDPRVQRIKRAESFAGSALYPPGSPLKCVPSLAAMSKRSSDAMSVDHSNRSDITTSSDEEEKMRSKRAKKPRVKPASPTPPAAPSVAVSPPKPKLRRTTKQISKNPSTTTKESTPRSSKPSTTLQRNSSILGPELPVLPADVAARVSTRPCSVIPAPSSPIYLRHLPHSPHSPYALPSPKRGQQRRAKGPSLGRPSVGRKISFGSLVPSEQACPDCPSRAAGQGLDSAFQLQ